MSVDPGRWIADQWVPLWQLPRTTRRWCKVCVTFHRPEDFTKDTGACVENRNRARRRRYRERTQRTQ